MPRFEPDDLSQVPLDELAELLEGELRADVGRALGPAANQHLYVLALCIGERATSAYVTANTEEHLRAAVAEGGDPSDPYWRWECPGEWAVIEGDSLRETNRFLSDLRRAHDAWLWSLDPDERLEKSDSTWRVLEARLVDLLHDSLRRLTVGGLPLVADQESCAVCLLSLHDPEFTEWSARQLNGPTLIEREFGSSRNSRAADRRWRRPDVT